MQRGECRVSTVFANEKIVGLLTAGNIAELLTLEAAAHQTGAR